MSAADRHRTAERSGSTALSEILLASLAALADAGQAEAACRLAARACAVMRGREPAQWNRFNALLHRLSPMTGDVGIRPARAHDGGIADAAGDAGDGPHSGRPALR